MITLAKWYNLDEKGKVQEFYSKHTIKDFWEWWSDNEERVMEIRITDFNLIQQVSNKLGIPYSSSGVYVNRYEQLKRVIVMLKNNTTCWFGVQPRKKNYNKKGWKVFGSGPRGGTADINVSEITHIFLDIDRVNKEGGATKEDLKNCDILADLVLERLGTENWNKNYIKIASGNGVQLLIKLDVPFKVPNVEFKIYNNNGVKEYNYETNDEYEKTLKLISSGFGKDVLKFSRKYKTELGVEIDKVVFNLSRVGALPVTKNMKNNPPRWRGIIEMRKGENVGLSDYILECGDNKITINKSIFTKTKSLSPFSQKLIKGKLHENKIVRLMLDYNLEYGEINNKLWFQLKVLIRDSKYDIKSEEFKKFHREIEQKYKGNFTMNLPTKKYSFDENIVNSFCINQLIPPVYPLWPDKTKQLDYGINELDWGAKDLVDDKIILDSDNTIIEDMKTIKKKLVEGHHYYNIQLLAKFINACIEKYGEEKAKYYYDYLFQKYFGYQ